MTSQKQCYLCWNKADFLTKSEVWICFQCAYTENIPLPEKSKCISCDKKECEKDCKQEIDLDTDPYEEFLKHNYYSQSQESDD